MTNEESRNGGNGAPERSTGSGASGGTAPMVRSGNGDGAPADSQWPLWEVFMAPGDGAPHEHAGSVHAADAEQALQNARDVYSRRGEGNSIWVVPSVAITASTPEDIGPFFDPANDKVYRHPQFYKVPRGVRVF